MDTSSIYDNIVKSFKAETGNQVYDDSDLGIRMKIVASEMSKMYEELTFCERQIFPQTATGIYLERHGKSRGITKKPADGAKGMLSFSSNTNASQDIIIPALTLCTSSTGNGVMYETMRDAVLQKGTSTVSVEARATQTGPDTNIIANKIDTIVNQISGIDRVTNPQTFAGGCAYENEETYRNRIMEAYIVYPNGANLKYFEELALEHDSVFYARAVASTTTNNVDIYISDYFRFTTPELVAEVQERVNNQRAFNTTITIKPAVPIVLDVTVKLYLKALGNTTDKSLLIHTYLNERIFEHTVGQPFNPYMVGEGIRPFVEELLDIDFVTPATAIPVALNKIITPGRINVLFERRD